MLRISRIVSVQLYFIPVQTRVPLKFGQETLTSVTCARVRVSITTRTGHVAEGWGETPLSVQWAWPGALPYQRRHELMKAFCRDLATAWLNSKVEGHPLEIGHAFLNSTLPLLLDSFNQNPTPSDPAANSPAEPMPHLAALICNAAFDLALHDAFGHLAERPVYETYGPDFLESDLAEFLEPAEGTRISFENRFPCDFLTPRPTRHLVAWHLVGGLDALDTAELTGTEPRDGHPLLLGDWIVRDGLQCLKVKLRGNDAAWDYNRLIRVGQIGQGLGVVWLSADFNCTVTDPVYVNSILDQLRDEHPRIFGMLLYVEQPFPYELEHHQIDVHSLSSRKPLFLDESAHDWRMIRLGRALGWNGVALKTCKTQTGAILSACWARAHGMALMVQDLTNPMLAQIPHVLLAAHAGTIKGVETNSMQFYPAASEPEAAVHPGLFQRRHGQLNLETLHGHGFGYRLNEIQRTLPSPDIDLCQ